MTFQRRLDASIIESLFSAEVTACVASKDMFDERSLSPLQIAGFVGATEARRQEFAAGRNAARNALARLGHHDGSVGRYLNGAPEWPVGATGSITHFRQTCVAVVGNMGPLLSVGLDGESLDEIITDNMFEMICSPQERQSCERLKVISDANWPVLYFAAKEAFYKCAFPLIARFLDFSAVTVTVTPAAGGLHGCVEFADACDDPIAVMSCGSINGRFAIVDNAVFVGVEALC